MEIGIYILSKKSGIQPDFNLPIFKFYKSITENIWAAKPAHRPPMVWERMAELVISFVFRASIMAIWVDR